MARGVGSIVAAGVVGVIGWALMRQAQDRAEQKASFVPASAPTGSGDNIAGTLLDGLFGVLEGVRLEQPDTVQDRSRSVLDNLIGDVSSRFPTIPTQTVGVPTQLTPATSAPVSAGGGGVRVDYELRGKKRPYAPEPEITNVIKAAMSETFGAGSRVVIYSGQEKHLPQYGSNRHKTGQAADIRIYDAAGKHVRWGSRNTDMHRFAKSCAKNGAKGIGYGAGYMAGNMHVDMVLPGEGQWYYWKSGAKAIGSELMALMNAAGNRPGTTRGA